MVAPPWCGGDGEGCGECVGGLSFSAAEDVSNNASASANLRRAIPMFRSDRM